MSPTETPASDRPERHAGRRERRPGKRGRARRRAGYIYLAVLFTTMIVVAVVAASLAVSTADLRGESDRHDRGEALRFAESELHRIAAGMNGDDSWRASASSGVFSSWRGFSVDGVKLSTDAQSRFRLVDADGRLDDDPTDQVELTVHARVGRAEAAVVATLEPDPVPLDFLHYSVTALDDIQYLSSVALSGERPIQVVDDCKTSAAGVITTPQLEYGGSLEMILRGDSAAANVVAPPADLISQYVALGQEISIAALPRGGGDCQIDRVVLSPTSNPFGPTNARGIYWIDANREDICIANCRLDATLVILDASAVLIQDAISWNYPTEPDAILLTDSPIVMSGMSGVLDEQILGVNLNPPSSPYRGGRGNGSTNDKYPTELRGMIYTTGNLRLDPFVDDSALQVSGLIVCRDLRLDANVNIASLDELIDRPPMPLSDLSPIRIVRGSIRRIPSP